MNKREKVKLVMVPIKIATTYATTAIAAIATNKLLENIDGERRVIATIGGGLIGAAASEFVSERIELAINDTIDLVESIKYVYDRKKLGL